MKRILNLSFASFFLVLAGDVLADRSSGLDYLNKSKLSAEPGAIYIEDTVREPIKLRAVGDVPIFYQLDMGRRLGTVAKATEVTVVALAPDDRYRVRGRAMHGDVAGWMKATDLASPDPKFVENLRTMYEREKLVRELIAKNEIAIGMTVEEVQASIGDPNAKSFKIDAGGRKDVLEYITYEKVPQKQVGRDAFGNLVQTTIYVKVETGRLSVTFDDGVVSSMEEKEGIPAGAGGVKIVPGPINIGF